MARKKSSARSNYIKIGWIALGIVILFGIVANIDQTFVPSIDTIPFVVPIPLDVIRALEIVDPNSFAECRIWTQGTIETESSVGTVRTTTLPFVTEIFDPDIRALSVVDIRTGDEVKDVNVEIHMRCDQREGGSIGEGVTGFEFNLVGGTITTQWTAIDGDGTLKSVTETSLDTLPVTNILFDDTSSGVTIKTTKITGTQIDNALSSTREVYFTKPTLIITVKPDFQFKFPAAFIDDIQRNVEVSLSSSIGNVKVFNQVQDPPSPTSEIVKLSVLKTSPEPLKDNSADAKLEIRVQLPEFKEGEGSPTFSVSRPSTSSDVLIEVARDVPLTANKDITGGKEFFTTRFELNPDTSTDVGQKGLLQAGQWAVDVAHPSRTGVDGQFFTVFSDSQPTTKTVTKPVPTNGEDPQKVNGDPPPDDDMMFNFLSIGDFIECLTEGAELCPGGLNDSKFVPLYGIIVVIVLLSVVSGRRG
jgi:hypothetical protein